jgi:LysR family hydrogen peroxide-inducible transcriptional activator
VVAQARRVLAEAQRLVELARRSDEPLAGPLRLGVIATLGPYLVPHVLRPLRERFAKLQLVLSEGRTEDIVSALRSGNLDAILAAVPLAGDGLVVRELFFEPFVLAAPRRHAVLGRAATRISDLDTADLMLLEEGHCLRDQALALCGPVARLPGHLHATSLETLRHLIAAGNGYSIMPALAAAETLDGLIVYRRFEDSAAGRTIAMVCRAADPRQPEFELLAEALRDYIPKPARALTGQQESAHPARATRASG